MLKKHIYLALTLVATTSFQNGAWAQWRQTKKNAPPTPVKRLMSPLPFPDVPVYTGQARFVSGDQEDDNNGNNLRQTWRIKETREQAVDWYKNALSSAGWKVTAGRGTVSGTKKGAAVMIFVNEIPMGDNFRSEMMMQYYKTASK